MLVVIIRRFCIAAALFGLAHTQAQALNVSVMVRLSDTLYSENFSANFREKAEKEEKIRAWENGIMDSLFSAGLIVTNITGEKRGLLKDDIFEAGGGGADYLVIAEIGDPDVRLLVYRLGNAGGVEGVEGFECVMDDTYIAKKAAKNYKTDEFQNARRAALRLMPYMGGIS